MSRVLLSLVVLLCASGAKAGGRRKIPNITLVVGQTLDGRIATKSKGMGLGQEWISGREFSSDRVHRLRAEHDGIMVGVNTVLNDNPRLLSRIPGAKKAMRFVLDTKLRTPLDAKVLVEHPEQTTLLVGADAPAEKVAAIERLGAKVLRVPTDVAGHLDLKQALRRISSTGIRSLMVEGGSEVITSLLKHRIPRRMVSGISPKLYGKGTDLVGDIGISQPKEAIALEPTSVQMEGKDIVLDAKIRYPGGQPRSTAK